MASGLDASPQLPVPLSVFADDPHSEAFYKQLTSLQENLIKKLQKFIFRNEKITKLLTAHKVEQREGFKQWYVGGKGLIYKSYTNGCAKCNIVGTGNK